MLVGKYERYFTLFSGLKYTPKQCTESSHLFLEIRTGEKLTANTQETKLKLVL